MCDAASSALFLPFQDVTATQAQAGKYYPEPRFRQTSGSVVNLLQLVCAAVAIAGLNVFRISGLVGRKLT